ncbi:MAG: PQQ-binding-like beta-propeller repeat protein [Candidatus Nanohaloarchaea archaeon]|nr:PQQ-binding-like beta-propeller repeat protein [Candidatus Nanohaloarchaea archaeon]
MKQWLGAVLIASVLLAGCVGNGGNGGDQFAERNITKDDIFEMVKDQADVYDYIQRQRNPKAGTNFWAWSAIQRLGTNFTCYPQLEQGSNYFRVTIFGNTSVMDVWMEADSYRIHCAKVLGREEAIEQGIHPDQTDKDPISKERDDDDNDQDGTNNTGNGTTGSDLSLSITGYGPTATGHLVYVAVSSGLSSTVQTTLEYGSNSRSIQVSPGDNTYSIETTQTGDVTFTLTYQDSDTSNNADTVTLQDDSTQNDTNNGNGGTTNDTDSNTTDGTEVTYNFWMDAFTIYPDDPNQGDDVDFGIRINSTRFKNYVDLVITSGAGTTIRSKRIAVNGTRILTITYTYDGEDSFTATLDPDNEYNETDETDNSRSVTVSSGGTQDVAVTGVRTDPADPHNQENISLIADLSSDGYNGDVTVTFSWDGSQVGSKTISISSGVSTSVSVHKVVSSGSHDLTASISLSDGNTDNNQASKAVDVADYTTFNVNWERNIGYPALNLIHDSGTLYTLAAGIVFALDANSGDTKWRKDVGHNVESPLSPIMGNGFLFYGENAGNQAVGFSISSQSVAWTYKTGYSVRSGAAYADGRVFMGSDDGSMYAYDASSGDVLWSKGGGELRSKPAVKGSTVYHGQWDPATIYARDVSGGSLKWSVGLSGKIERSSPYVGSSNVYVGTTAGTMYAISRSSQSVIWQFDAGSEITSSPTLADGKVVFGGSGGKVYAAWAANGTQAWSFQTSSTGTVTASPAAASDTVYIGSPNGVFYALDIDTGTRNCEYDTGAGSIVTRPTIVGDTVYTSTQSDKVFSFQTCPS